MEPTRLRSPRVMRKALMADRGVTITGVARELGLSALTVSTIVADRNKHETPNSRRIKQLIAERVGVPVVDLWPEADVGSDSRATEARNGNAGGAE